MHRLRADVHRFTGQHLPLRKLPVDLDLEEQPAGLQEDRLVLQIVILEAERVAGLHVDQFADVSVRFGPVKLVSPGFVHTRNLTGHNITPLWRACRARSAARVRCPRWSTAAAPVARVTADHPADARPAPVSRPESRPLSY